MILNLTRTKTTRDAIIGFLTVNDVWECYTLENRDLAIPVGTYEISMYLSPKNKCEVFLLDVPGREYIEIHPANYAYQLEGCIAPGTETDGETVSYSRNAFNKLKQLVKLPCQIVIS